MIIKEKASLKVAQGALQAGCSPHQQGGAAGLLWQLGGPPGPQQPCRITA